jgi:hypothetical protein
MKVGNAVTIGARFGYNLIVRASNRVKQMQTFTQAPDTYSHLIHTFQDLVAPFRSPWDITNHAKLVASSVAPCQRD